MGCEVFFPLYPWLGGPFFPILISPSCGVKLNERGKAPRERAEILYGYVRLYPLLFAVLGGWLVGAAAIGASTPGIVHVEMSPWFETIECVFFHERDGVSKPIPAASKLGSRSLASLTNHQSSQALVDEGVVSGVVGG